MLGGNDDPICALRTRVREVRVSRVSGRAPSAVSSRWSDVSLVNASKPVGNEPATEVARSKRRTQQEIVLSHTRRVSIPDDCEGFERGEIRKLFRDRCRNAREGKLSTRSRKKVVAV
jgi:hypothetical protein